ncbi:MAG: 16S rRNA (uracil(1498)-N(3))-methyltransferase [Bacteroidetes bacterium]|nr:16S rRNA (uracil(1498)-N(3))-methyltransferase [Bacteroidota bacterium]
MHRFYTPELTIDFSNLTLSEQESKHAVQVMRLQNDQQIELFNGKGLSAIATVIDNHPKRCSVRIDQKSEHPEEKPIHIAIAPTKNMERLEWFIEKATEIGITKISFIICQNSERREVKTERLEKILISAVKQSGRYFLPIVIGPIKWKDFLKQYPTGLIAHCREGEKMKIETSFQNKVIVIGPEGDFTVEEIELALTTGYVSITLGENRLRTETAALVACIQAKFSS